jgi:hypothetical protein
MGDTHTMTLISLQTLTWTTVAGAVVGALLLASSPSAEADRSKSRSASRAPSPSHGTMAAQRPTHIEPGSVRQVTHHPSADVSAR